ncbi:MAG: homogentisate 1,2-dioxygenase [Actinomycetia bacterium]|nr:homogentisate 1,2-dioxygenase [Actinomycetes bacterium]
MPHYRRVGDVPRKRHTVHRVDGSVVYEELMGVEGFSGASTLLYHRHSPSAILSVEPLTDAPRVCWHPNHPLRPHHLRTGDLSTATATAATDAVLGRRPLLGNDDVEIAWVRASATSPLFRDAMGDELVYVHDGSAVLESGFGCLDVATGDYVVVPRSTTHRWVTTGPVELLVLVARGHVTVPPRYLNAHGQLVEGAPFSERDQRGPSDAPIVVDGTEVPVVVRTASGMSVHVHATHPFDVVGWDGCVYPWAMSIHDFEPIVGRVHQPPPVHQTFAGPNFVVCSFVPRPYDFDPDAVKVPYHHANVDSDEVLFYSAGDFMSRAGSGIGAGSISVHPAGFVHGPQPGNRERSVDATRTEELAVMLDTFRPLMLSDDALRVSDPEYPFSWSR